jgi:hypothetical protein
MKTKLQSPVVWATVFTSIVAQLKILEDGEITPIKVTMAVCTVAIAFFGALNNPNDTRNF